MQRFVFAAALLVAAQPAQAQIGYKIAGGATFNEISSAPPGFTESSGTGYFIGGAIRTGQFLYIEPGVYYQEQRITLRENATGIQDGVGIRSTTIPVIAGVNFNLAVASVRAGLGPTLTFQGSVSGNDFGFVKDDFKGTRFGYMLNLGVRVLFLAVDFAWQQDFSNAFDDTSLNGNGKLGTFRVGIGVGI
jgi:hypothetical protein